MRMIKYIILNKIIFMIHIINYNNFIHIFINVYAHLYIKWFKKHRMRAF